MENINTRRSLCCQTDLACSALVTRWTLTHPRGGAGPAIHTAWLTHRPLTSAWILVFIKCFFRFVLLTLTSRPASVADTGPGLVTLSVTVTVTAPGYTPSHTLLPRDSYFITSRIPAQILTYRRVISDREKAMECFKYFVGLKQSEKILATFLSLSWRGVPASFLLLDRISRPMLKAAIPDRFPVQGSRTEKSLT